jgi:hypothetical protein
MQTNNNVVDSMVEIRRKTAKELRGAAQQLDQARSKDSI